MADEADLGNESVETALNISLSNRIVYSGESAVECEECGSNIPEARRRAVPGVQTCIACAERAEAVKRHRR